MVGSEDSLANFNCKLNMCFKYHPESAQIIYSPKGNKKPYKQSCMNKVAAVCPRPLYKIHNFGISFYQARDLKKWDTEGTLIYALCEGQFHHRFVGQK
jgi:hypothetical protein